MVLSKHRERTRSINTRNKIAINVLLRTSLLNNSISYTAFLFPHKNFFLDCFKSHQRLVTRSVCLQGRTCAQLLIFFKALVLGSVKSGIDMDACHPARLTIVQKGLQTILMGISFILWSQHGNHSKSQSEPECFLQLGSNGLHESDQ